MSLTDRMLRCLLSSAAAVVVAATTALAQSPYSLTISDRDIHIEPFGFANFKIDVHNTSGSQIAVRIFRIKNILPDKNWASAICTGQLCFPPDVDAPQAPILEPNGAVDVQLSISAGDVVGSKGEFTLVLDSGPGTKSDTIDMSAIVASVGSVPTDLSTTSSLAWPNPSRSMVSISSPAGFTPDGSGSLSLFDARGNQIPTDALPSATVSADGALSLDVSALPIGAYFYRITGRERSVNGSFVVAR